MFCILYKFCSSDIIILKLTALWLICSLGWTLSVAGRPAVQLEIRWSCMVHSLSFGSCSSSSASGVKAESGSNRPSRRRWIWPRVNLLPKSPRPSPRPTILRSRPNLSLNLCPGLSPSLNQSPGIRRRRKSRAWVRWTLPLELVLRLGVGLQSSQLSGRGRRKTLPIRSDEPRPSRKLSWRSEETLEEPARPNLRGAARLTSNPETSIPETITLSSSRK